MTVLLCFSAVSKYKLRKGGEGDMNEEKRISGWQLFFDDISMLFFLGIVIPTVFYLIWGLMEYANAPTAVITVS